MIVKRWLSAFVIFSVMTTMLAFTVPVFADDDELGIDWMCVGDSITYGNKVPGGYRAPLYKLYKNSGVNLRMVGPNSMNNGDGLLPAGSGHAGYGGYYIREISDKIVSWLESYRPQVVSLQIGTNDMLMNKASKYPDDKRDTAPDRISALIDKITQTLPEAEVFVAKIPPINSTGFNPHFVKYNEALETVTASKGSKVHLVDNYTALNDDLSANLQEKDGLHPTLVGYEKMAASWFEASNSIVSKLTRTVAQQIRATARTGEHMLHLTSPGSASFKNTATKELTVEENTDYTAEFYIKGDTGTTIMGRAVTSDWGTILINRSFECGPNWSKCSFTFNTGANPKIMFTLFDDSATAGNIYVDDCSLVKTNTSENLIKNPSFEEQKEGWSLNSIFEVLSQNYLEPPESIEQDGEKPVVKTVSVSMDTFTGADASVPSDITCLQLDTVFYTKPDEVTEDYIDSTKQAGRNKIFYKTTNPDKGYIMVNSNGSDKNAIFKLDKPNYNQFTGFDEMRIKCKMMKQKSNGVVDESRYTGDWGKLSNYYLTVNVGDLENSVTKVNSKGVKLLPTRFATLEDDQWEEYVIKRSDFAGENLSMDGKLGSYEENGMQHDMLLTFKAKSRGAWLIDQIDFVWYDNEPNAKISELNFSHDNEIINAYGLQPGVNTLAATLHNTTSANLEKAHFFYALYNKKTELYEEIKEQTFSLDGGETTEVILSVEVPGAANPRDYEARIIMMNGETLAPMLKEVYRFGGNGVVKN